MYTVYYSKDTHTHTQTLFPVDLLSHTTVGNFHCLREAVLTSKPHLPPPGKQGQVCMKTLRVGASVKYQCHQVFNGGTFSGFYAQKLGLSHGVHCHACVCVCVRKFVCIIAALYVMASRCIAIQIQELDHLCATINNTLPDSPFLLIPSVCVCVLAFLALWFFRLSHLIIKKECRLPTVQENTKETSKHENNLEENEHGCCCCVDPLFM